MRPVNRLWLAAGMGLLLLAGCKRPAEKPPVPSNASWLIDAESYYASPHGDLKCTECHLEEMSEGETFPHGPTDLQRRFELDQKVCERCHRQAYREHARGAHAHAAEEEEKALQQGLEPASVTGSIYRAPHCYDCHPIHYRLEPGEE